VASAEVNPDRYMGALVPTETALNRSVSFPMTSDVMPSEVSLQGRSVATFRTLVRSLLPMNCSLVSVKNRGVGVFILTARTLEDRAIFLLFHALAGLLMSTQVVLTMGVVPTVALELLELFLFFQP